MELKARILCRPEVAPGFEAAGARVERAREAGAAEALRRLADDPDVGVVLVEERLRRALPADLVQHVDRAGHPIVVPFPSPAWAETSAAEEYVMEILRQAVGYRVRPR